MSSHRPYLIRAIREWAIDNNLTPQLVVNASVTGVKVPDEFIEDGQIILNVSPQAVSHLEMGNELISFSARFRGVARSVEVPVDAVLAVFDRETRQGMSFPAVTDDEDVADDESDSQPPARGKPKLKLVE
ncbi:MAG: ClpXP protease specificity-enhancing factor [Arenicellales bacterium]